MRKVLVLFPDDLSEYIQSEQNRRMEPASTIIRDAVRQVMAGISATTQSAEPKRGPGRPPKEKAPEPEPIVGYQSVEEIKVVILSILTEKGPTGEKVKYDDIVKADPRIRVTDGPLWFKARDILYTEKKLGMNGECWYLRFETAPKKNTW